MMLKRFPILIIAVFFTVPALMGQQASNSEMSV